MKWTNVSQVRLHINHRTPYKNFEGIAFDPQCVQWKVLQRFIRSRCNLFKSPIHVPPTIYCHIPQHQWFLIPTSQGVSTSEMLRDVDVFMWSINNSQWLLFFFFFWWISSKVYNDVTWFLLTLAPVIVQNQMMNSFYGLLLSRCATLRVLQHQNCGTCFLNSLNRFTYWKHIFQTVL